MAKKIFMFFSNSMEIHSINACQNEQLLFQAKPKIILTKEVVKKMSAADILELSSGTLKQQDIKVLQIIRSKIRDFIYVLTSKYSHLKANVLFFSNKELATTKANKSKAKRIEKLLSDRINEEKRKRGIEINSGRDDFIPIEYIILPEEEKIHQKIIKMDDLITDKCDADRYKYQRAKHDRDLSRSAMSQIGKLLREKKTINAQYNLDIVDIDKDYLAKKIYNNFVEQILFAETGEELNGLREKIRMAEIDKFFKDDLEELIKRKEK